MRKFSTVFIVDILSSNDDRVRHVSGKLHALTRSDVGGGRSFCHRVVSVLTYRQKLKHDLGLTVMDSMELKYWNQGHNVRRDSLKLIF